MAPAGSTGAADGVCNEQVPNNSVYARFLWVVRFLTHNGFYVVVENHLAVDNTAIANPQQWAALWAQVLAPSSCRRVRGSAVEAFASCITTLDHAMHAAHSHATVCAQSRCPSRAGDEQ